MIADADGSAKRIIVSDWIKNAPGSASIRDKTEMEDATERQRRQRELYDEWRSHMRVWDANGNGHLLSGEILKKNCRVKPLPSATNWMESQSLRKNWLSARGGRVTIRFEYIKYPSMRWWWTRWATRKIYVPFRRSLTGMILDNREFSRISRYPMES
ncbi:MAG: hypothetical protein ACLR23_00435 [Clostridia bacterium]